MTNSRVAGKRFASQAALCALLVGTLIPSPAAANSAVLVSSLESPSYLSGSTLWRNSVAGAEDGTVPTGGMSKVVSPEAVSFTGRDGTNSDRVEGSAGSLTGITTVTVEMYLKLLDSGSAQNASGSMLFSWDNGPSQYSYNIYHTGGFVGFNTFSSELYGIDASSLENKWTHFVFVMTEGTSSQQTTQKIYVNGTLQAIAHRLADTTPVSRSIPDSGDFILMDHNVSQNNWNAKGDLAFAKVYKNELTQAQVTAAYKALPKSNPAQSGVKLDAESASFSFQNQTALVDANDSKLVGSAPGDIVRFNNFTTINGQAVDAVMKNLNTGTSYATVNAVNAGTPNNLSLSTSNTSDFSRNLYQLDFYQAGTVSYSNGAVSGIPVTLQNLSFNSYDLDGSPAEFVEYFGFQQYQIANITGALAVSTPGDGWVRFTATQSSWSPDDPGSRAKVTYNEVSSMKFALGVVGTHNGRGINLEAGFGKSWNNAALTTVSNPANSAPTSTNDAVNVATNGDLTLAVNDFGIFYDADDNPLSKVQITTVPGSGKAQRFNGTTWQDLSNSSEVNVSDINLGNLRISNPSTSTSLTFKVHDALVYSVSTYTLWINVAGQPQTITFPDPGTKRTDGDPGSETFSSNATATSGLVVSLSTSTPGVCTVSGLNITVVSLGTCSVTASQAGDGVNWGAAPSVTRVFSVSNDLAQTITFSDPGSQTAGQTIASNATASSGLTVTLISQTTNVCTISSLNIVLVANGSCTVIARQSGGTINGSTFAAASDVTRTFSVVTVPTVTLSYANQTVPTLSSSPTLNAGGSPGTPAYTLLSLPSADSASGCAVNVSTGVVTATSAGQCKVSVTIGASGGYTEASAEAIATFLKSSQSISWTNTTVDVRSPAGVVTQRNLTSNPNYATAVDVQYTLQLKLGETVKIPFNSPNSQRVGYTSHANCPSVVGWNGEQSMFVFDGSGNSNYYIKANRVGGCSISSGNHTPQRLTLPSNLYTNYFSSGILITVVKGDQSPIEVTGPTTANFGETVKIDATGGSGTGARTYSVTGTGCTITTIPLVFGNRTYTALSTAELTKSGAGACSVTVTKAGDNNYEAITSAGYTVTFGQGSQEIGFTSVVPALPVASDTYTPVATSSSGLTVAFTASGTCTYDFLTGQVTFTGSGNCTVTASQAGNSDYLAATDVTQVIAVGERNQTISFAAISDKEYGDPAFQVSATSSANLTVTFSSANTNVCTINSSGVIVLKTAGTCTIHADQAGQAGTVAAASRVSRSFTVFAAGSSAPFITSVSRGVGSLSANIIAPSYTGGASILRYEVQAFDSAGDLVSFNNNCAPADPQVCTVEGLAEGVNYTLKARAHHNGGVGAFSPSSIAASPIGNPDAVRALSATAGNTTLRIQWLKPLDLGGASFVRYDVFYREVGAANYQAQALQINCGGDLTGCGGLYDITGLTNGTSYEVKMITVTNFADSELVSNTALVSQVPYTTPDAVRDLSATEVGENLLITWRYPDFDGGRQITSYTVDVNSGGLSCTPGVERYCTVPTTTIASFDIDTFANNIAGASSAANFVFTRQVPQQGGGGSGGGGGDGSSGEGTPPIQQVPDLGAPALRPASPTANAGIPTALELSGSNLNLINGVFIGLQSLQFEILSNEKIRVIIPARSAGELTLEFRYTGGMIEKKVVVRQASRAAVNAGTFRGVVALYAAGYAGQRFSAKVGRDWVVVDRLSSNYVRLIERVGAGRELKINIFINRKLVRTIDLTTR